MPYRVSTRPSETLERLVSTADAPPQRRSLAIMVVDDVEMNREFVEIALGKAGHRVTSFASAQAAIDGLNAGTVFDLILMDVQMPDLDGLTATRLIRSLPAPANETPIFGLTANALPEQVAECLQAGMDDHIAKPINSDRLIARIDRLEPRTSHNVAPTDQPDASDHDKALAALTVSYRNHLKSLPDEIERIRRSEPFETIRGLAILAHSVAGTAGSLGFSEISDAAFDLEACAQQEIDHDTPSPELEQVLQRFSRALDLLN